MAEAELRTPETTFDDLADIERDWRRNVYVEFPRRQAMVRYARIGLAVEMLSERINGPLRDELKRLMRNVTEPRMSA